MALNIQTRDLITAFQTALNQENLGLEIDMFPTEKISVPCLVITGIIKSTEAFVVGSQSNLKAVITLALADSTKKWEDFEDNESKIFRALHQNLPQLQTNYDNNTDKEGNAKILSVKILSIQTEVGNDKEESFIKSTFSVEVLYSVKP